MKREYQFACGHKVTRDSLDIEKRHVCQKCGADTIVLSVKTMDDATTRRVKG